jgi:spore maturation protein CgeB
VLSIKILAVSDKRIEVKKSDFLVNAIARKYHAKVIYTRRNLERVYFIDRVLNKIHIELDKSNINQRLLAELASNQYNLVFIIKGNRIHPWTLRKIKLLYPNIKLISWSGDNMTKWHNKSFFYHFGINYYDILLSINIPDYKKIEAFFKNSIYYFDKVADLDTHKPLNSSRTKFKYDVIFIGSYEKDRFLTLNYLAKQGIKITIFGNMWEKCKQKTHSNLNIKYQDLIGKNYVETIYHSKITLGFLRKINNDTQTSRSFEIPAVGGFMLMERTDDHLRIFEEGKEAEFFNDNEELLKKIRYYLNHDGLRESIAKNGFLKVKKSGYYFENLVDRMMEKINNENL